MRADPQDSEDPILEQSASSSRSQAEALVTSNQVKAKRCRSWSDFCCGREATACVFSRAKPGTPARRREYKETCLWCDAQALAEAEEDSRSRRSLAQSLNKFKEADPEVFDRAMARFVLNCPGTRCRVRTSSTECVRHLFYNVFDFISTERSKPGRESSYVVTHAKPDWSAIHIEDEPASVQNQIDIALETTFGVSVKPVTAHRWRFARPTDPTLTTQKGVFEIDEGLWVAGDYLAGGRVEGAYLSGIEAADRLNR